MDTDPDLKALGAEATREVLDEMARRRRRPLSSELIELAQLRNPGLQVRFEPRPKQPSPLERERAPGTPLALVVGTDRGEAVYHKRNFMETWLDVFERAALL